jgi:hypothetical protein
MASEGMESTAQDGTMMACVWVARKSNLEKVRFRAEVKENDDADLLEDYVKYPRRLSGDVDVVNSVPCAGAVGRDIGTWCGVMGLALRTALPRCHNARMGLCS